MRAPGLLACLAALSTAAGCELREIRDPDVQASAKEILGTSVEGRSIDAWVFPGDAPAVLILGGIHGDEPSSAALVWALKMRLDGNGGERRGRQVVLIPCANPDGLSHRTRENARGIDLNRNFPARNFRPGRSGGAYPASEPETLALLRALRQYDPSRIVSVHAPLRCVDPDGGPEASTLARSMAETGGLPVKDLPAHPGSLGTYAGLTLRLEMITYELEHRVFPGGAIPPRHLDALIRALRREK